MAIVKIDHLSTLDCQERNGVIRSLTRAARVTGLFNIDYNVLIAALDAAGVPIYGSSLPEPEFSSLILVDRSVRLVGDDKGSADVILKYEHLLDGPNQKIPSLTGKIYGRGRCSIQEKDTNFYYPFGIGPASAASGTVSGATNTSPIEITTTDHSGLATGDSVVITGVTGNTNANGTFFITVLTGTTFLLYSDAGRTTPVAGNAAYGSGGAWTRVGGAGTIERQRITVSHQFPATDPDNPLLEREQIGNVKAPFPQGNYSFEGIKITTDPVGFAWGIIRTINAKVWLGQPALTWLCSEVKWEVISADKNTHRFSFEFQNDPDTWDPDVVFDDNRTNHPPSDVVLADVVDDYGVLRLRSRINPVPAPAGAWKVPILKRLDYDVVFNTVAFL